jgi:hypothetical protein
MASSPDSGIERQAFENAIREAVKRLAEGANSEKVEGQLFSWLLAQHNKATRRKPSSIRVSAQNNGRGGQSRTGWSRRLDMKMRVLHHDANGSTAFCHLHRHTLGVDVDSVHPDLGHQWRAS